MAYLNEKYKFDAHEVHIYHKAMCEWFNSNNEVLKCTFKKPDDCEKCKKED